MKKLCFVFGTRPEAIKLAPVVLLARRQQDRFTTHVCVTGQHRQMLDQMLAVFDITPDVDLDLMRPNQTLADISARTIQGVSGVLETVRPDWVLVQGDTTTVWAAAVAAFFLGIRVAHVEAGLRTNDRRQPFPEEINRRLASQIAHLHFAPTEQARANLLAEGIPTDCVVVTGNTVIDALHWMLEKNRTCPSPDVAAIRDWTDRNVGDRRMVLITGHRRESFGKGFENICRAIATLAADNPDVAWVYPVHLNPNVQEPVRAILGDVDGVHLVEPQPYAAFAWLMDRSCLILTDSGGVQEEAPSLGKPVLVMRNKTERPEGVEAGVVRLVGNDYERIVGGCREVLVQDLSKWPRVSPYGDGHATERILRALAETPEETA